MNFDLKHPHAPARQRPDFHHGDLVHGLGALLSRHLLPPLVQLPGLAAALRAGAPPISDPVVRHACGRCERVHDRSGDGAGQPELVGGHGGVAGAGYRRVLRHHRLCVCLNLPAHAAGVGPRFLAPGCPSVCLVGGGGSFWSSPPRRSGRGGSRGRPCVAWMLADNHQLQLAVNDFGGQL